MTVAEWDSDPLIPVTVTGIVPPNVNVQDSVDDPEPVTLNGVRVQDELLAERFTTPLNPF